MANPKACVPPVYKFKTATHKALCKAATVKPDFTYILLCNSAFLDWVLERSLRLNRKESKLKLFDGGKNVFSATTLDGFGRTGCCRYLESPGGDQEPIRLRQGHQHLTKPALRDRQEG